MKRFIYLISPSKINHNFYKDLDNVLSFKNVKYFQLRLKKEKKNNLLKIAKKIKKITEHNHIVFTSNCTTALFLLLKALNLKKKKDIDLIALILTKKETYFGMVK